MFFTWSLEFATEEFLPEKVCHIFLGGGQVVIHGSSDQLLKNTVIQDHTNKLFWCWCTEFRSCENATNRKNLTFDHDYLSAPTRSLQFFSWTCFRLWILSCKVGFSMGSCWRIKLWGLENCMRALFINGSGQCNVLRQWSRYQFSFFHICDVLN